MSAAIPYDGLWTCEAHPSRLWSSMHTVDEGSVCPDPDCAGPGMPITDSLKLLEPIKYGGAMDEPLKRFNHDALFHMEVLRVVDLLERDAGGREKVSPMIAQSFSVGAMLALHLRDAS